VWPPPCQDEDKATSCISPLLDLFASYSTSRLLSWAVIKSLEQGLSTFKNDPDHAGACFGYESLSQLNLFLRDSVMVAVIQVSEFFV